MLHSVQVCQASGISSVTSQNVCFEIIKSDSFMIWEALSESWCCWLVYASVTSVDWSLNVFLLYLVIASMHFVLTLIQYLCIYCVLHWINFTPYWIPHCCLGLLGTTIKSRTWSYRSVMWCVTVSFTKHPRNFLTAEYDAVKKEVVRRISDSDKSVGVRGLLNESMTGRTRQRTMWQLGDILSSYC